MNRPGPLAADVAGLVELQEVSYARAGAGAHASWPRERALDAEALRAFLSDPPFAVLATARADGRPQAAPFALVAHRGALWFALVDGPRLRALRRLPYASVVLTEGGPGSHRMLVAEGPVQLHDPSPELQALWRARLDDDAAWAGAFAELRPERLFSYDGRAQRAR